MIDSNYYAIVHQFTENGDYIWKILRDNSDKRRRKDYVTCYCGKIL